MPTSRVLLALVLGLATLLPAATQNSDRATAIRRLVPDLVFRDKISLSSSWSGGDARVEYRVAIPRDAYAVSFEILDSPTDLDLYLYKGNSSFAYAENDSFVETLLLTRRSDPQIEPGEYRLAVRYQLGNLPYFEGRSQYEIPFTIAMKVTRVESTAELRTDGQPVTGTVSPETAMIRAYTLQVPRGASKLRVDLSGTQADVDLYITRGGLTPDFFDTEYYSRSFGSSEWFILDPVQDATSTYGVVVVGVWDEVPVDFTISAATGVEAPAFLRQFPPLPASTEGLAQSILATVEILDGFGGGSGVIITPDGYIITNFHVIENSWRTRAQVRVNLSLDDSLPPREMFFADVVAVEPAHDLALLKVASGLYGQPVPSTYRLPVHPIGNPRNLRIGDTLTFIGYPAIGSLGSRTSVTMTRGIVGGFERRGVARVIKTDAQINYGNSGGAAIDSQGRLVGIPTERTFDDGGQIGYIYSVEQVPAEWWRMAGITPPF